jgi:sulfite exporter TauE/SafE
MNSLIIAAAFTLGIASSLHCLGMCGPLVMAVPFPHLKNRVLSKSLYFVGKALAYVFLGAIIGTLGLKAIWGNAQQYVAVFSGIILVLFTLLPFFQVKLKVSPIQRKLANVLHRMQDAPKDRYFFQLGFLNGLLPCGMVYIALTTALAAGNPIDGSLAMFSFGLGTTPVLWGLTLFKHKMSIRLRGKLKPIQITISFLVGVLLIFRGLGLGIPYISPAVATSGSAKVSCCAASESK